MKFHWPGWVLTAGVRACSGKASEGDKLSSDGVVGIDACRSDKMGSGGGGEGRTSGCKEGIPGCANDAGGRAFTA